MQSPILSVTLNRMKVKVAPAINALKARLWQVWL